MQIDNNNRAGIITAATIAGAGAGAVAGHYMPLVNAKSQATSDKFVKEVGKEINNNKAYNLVNAAAAKDYLDTIYMTKNGTSKEQVDKFFNRFGDSLEIKREEFVDDKGKPFTGKSLREKLIEVVDNKIAENGEVKFSDDAKKLELKFSTENSEAKALIKNGFDKKKLVKAGTAISEEGLDTLKRAAKTVRNERMIKGGVIAGLLTLATSAIATCSAE